jgi:hypothetical protein
MVRLASLRLRREGAALTGTISFLDSAMRPLLATVLLAGAALLAGCGTSGAQRHESRTLARFFLESSDHAGTLVALPQSGVRVTVNSKPVFTEGDILNVEIVQVDLGKCLMFQLTPTAARDFYRLTGAHQGRRLVLLVDDAPVGARRIDGAIPDGAVFVFVELPDSALPALVENLKRSSVAFQREIARKG